jgi:hypothetical protein
MPQHVHLLVSETLSIVIQALKLGFVLILPGSGDNRFPPQFPWDFARALVFTYLDIASSTISLISSG